MRLIHSPEAKRQKALDMRQEEFNEKMAGFFDEFGLLDFDKVQLKGIKPLRRALQEWAASGDQPMEVQGHPMMPTAASWSSRNSLHRLQMRGVGFESASPRISEISQVDFE
jgi:hypothetical protein